MDMEKKFDACENRWLRRILQISYRDRQDDKRWGQAEKATNTSEQRSTRKKESPEEFISGSQVETDPEESHWIDGWSVLKKT